MASNQRQGRIGTAFVLFLSVVTLGTGQTWAAKGGNPGPDEGGFNPASDTEDNHCVSPSGVDVNERWGVSEQIVAAFCTEADSGEFWTTTAIWIMDTSFASVPAGFVPDGDTPLEDFVAKFVALKYVVDPGTRQEQTYVYQNADALGIQEVDGLPVVNTVTMGRLHPLRPGPHVVETYWAFSAMHCDGLGDVVAENCFPAGETLYHGIGFDVVVGAP